LRNSRSIDLARRLTELGHDVALADPHVAGDEVEAQYGRGLAEPGEGPFDLVIGAVRHRDYASMDAAAIAALVSDGGTVADIKGMWRGLGLAPALDYWTL
jgi:UDP-N-acetyl-D-galactosamine dehydrogenase